MNRIEHLQSAVDDHRWTPRCEFDFAGVKVGSASNVFFIPSGYTPRYEYPLVVWLHHHGGNERDILRVLPHVSVQNYLGVGVRGCWATESHGMSFGWSDSPTGVAVAEQAVFDAIDGIAGRYSVHQRRIFLVGYCEGGTAALRIGLRHPRRFAGVVSLGGALPKSGRLLMNLKEAANFPLLLATYRDSVQWPIEEVCRDIRLMHGAGIRVDVRQYPESGELCTRILDDVNRWLMAQVTGSPMTELDEPVSFSKN